MLKPNDMKLNSFQLSIYIISLMICSSCSQTSNEPKITVFSGTITNNATKEIRIEGNDTIYKSNVDANGNFKIRFLLHKVEVFKYTGNEFATIYFSPGDSIHVSVDAINWRTFDKTLSFSGKGNEKNNYFFRKSLLEDKLQNFVVKTLFKKEESNFINALDSAIVILEDNFSKYQNITSPQEYDLLNVEGENIEYLKRAYILQYYIMKKREGEKLIKITPIVNSFIENIDFNRDEFMSLKAYQKFIIEYFKYLQFNERITNETERLSFIMISIDELISNSSFKELLVKEFLKEYFAANQFNTSILEAVKNKISSESYAILEKIYNDEKPLEEGDAAPDFIFIDKQGMEFSLNHFKGKYIYIDVWASYCGSCLKEVPYFEQLKQDYKGQNISFVSVSLDRKENAWLNALKKHGMTDYQFKVEDDWSSSFVKNYNLEHYGIPYYIVIDPDGKVIKLPAPKPSVANDFFSKIL